MCKFTGPTPPLNRGSKPTHSPQRDAKAPEESSVLEFVTCSLIALALSLGLIGFIIVTVLALVTE